MLDRPSESLWLAAAVAVAWTCSGCGSDPQCVIDTDCEALQVCNADNECVPRGGDVDASFDGGMPDAGDGGADGGDMDASQPDAGMDAGPERLGTGTLVATSTQEFQTSLGETASDYRVSASFAYAAEDDGSCTTDTLGPCTVTECAPPPSMDAGVADGGADAAMVDAGAPRPPPTAGDIRITGGTIDPIMLSPSDDMYPPQTGTQALWTAAGTTLMAEARHGGFEEHEVPEFDSSVQTPIDIVIEEPKVEPTTSISRAAPLDIAWTGTSSVGSLMMRLSGPGLGGDGATTSAECTFAVDSDAVTSGTVPTTVLGRFAAGTASLSFVVESSSRMEVDGWEITFLARSFAKSETETGAKASGSVTLE